LEQALTERKISRLNIGVQVFDVLYVQDQQTRQRGQAYLLLHQGKEAAGEVQKFIDHRAAG